jgi:hypothetical protein
MQFFTRLVRTYPFLSLWLLISIFYLPAWRSGFVTDAIDWLHDAKTLPFWDYLNRPHSTIKSLYQLTQLLTLGIYKIFGTARVPWYLLMTGMQALNGLLLFKFFKKLFSDSGISKAKTISAWGVVLVCLSPYFSETLVWKACFHYPLALLMMMSILMLVQRFAENGKKSLAIWAGILFAASSFSLELFYLTPVFTASLIIFYSKKLQQKKLLKTALLAFLLPQVLIFIGHLFLFNAYYGDWISHSNGSGLVSGFPEYLSKGVKYLFHVLFFGRFWPQKLKDIVYHFCENTAVITLTYVALVAIVTTTILARKRNPVAAPALLLLTWCIAATAIVLPMQLEPLFDLNGNRYLYLVVTFAVMLLALVVGSLKQKSLRYMLVAGWLLCSSFLLLRSNRHWQTSTEISDNLLKSVPAVNGRKMLFLSLPYCYKGVPMINAFPYGNFQRMHDALCEPSLNAQTHDVVAFNMVSPSDGADAEWANDSTIKVTLRQWGTWWWYKDFGATSYENEDYRVDMRDQGHWYEIVLKRPKEEYLMLYQQGKEWKELK